MTVNEVVNDNILDTFAHGFGVTFDPLTLVFTILTRNSLEIEM